jgi:hypothetical protein
VPPFGDLLAGGQATPPVVARALPRARRDDHVVLRAVEALHHRLHVVALRIDQHADLVLVVDHVAVFPVEEVDETGAVRLIVQRRIGMAGEAALRGALAETVDGLRRALDVRLQHDGVFEARLGLLGDLAEIVRELLNEGFGDELDMARLLKSDCRRRLQGVQRVRGLDVA